MNLSCLYSSPSDLPEPQRKRSTRFETAYPVTIGRTYQVVGMALWESVLHLLIPDDTGGPGLLAAALFEEKALQLPATWEFALRTGIRASGTDVWMEPVSAVWGYTELVRDPDHLGALMDRDEEALDIFERHLSAS